jgi:hypothetical protein
MRTPRNAEKTDKGNAMNIERRTFLKQTAGIAAGVMAAGAVSLNSYAADAAAKKEEWKSLFNGKDLTGWKAERGAVWTVEDGCIVGKQGPKGADGDLFTTEDYADFELIVTYKIQWPANSGVWFRYQTPEKSYQADILEFKNPVAYSGTIYCPGKMFLSKNEDPKLVNREGWNTMKILAQGDHLAITLNDKVTGDVHEGSFPTGKIGFQVHPGEEFKDMKITVKEIKIRLLK